MRAKTLLCAIFILCACCGCATRRAAFRVVDDRSGAPLPGVRVAVSSKRPGALPDFSQVWSDRDGGTSDARGLVQVRIDDQQYQSFTFRRDGYETSLAAHWPRSGTIFLDSPPGDVPLHRDPVVVRLRHVPRWLR